MKISNRLKTVGELVPNNSNVIDVGCDHALLDIYLYQTNKTTHITASDISDGPLKSAKDNLIKYNLDAKIKLIKQDGITNIDKDIDTIVISGMGSSTIIDILFKDKSKLTNIKSLIISSNNDYYKLRKIITNEGFYIKDEVIVLEHNKYYPIILFNKGLKKYNKFSLKYGPILLENKDNIYLKYLSQEKDKLININKSLSNKYIIKKIINKINIKKLTKIIG